MDEAAHQEMEVQWALSIRGECICLMKMHREHVYNENSGHGLREINIANKRAALVLISLGESGKIDRQITSPPNPRHCQWKTWVPGISLALVVPNLQLLYISASKTWYLKCLLSQTLELWCLLMRVGNLGLHSPNRQPTPILNGLEAWRRNNSLQRIRKSSCLCWYSRALSWNHPTLPKAVSLSLASSNSHFCFSHFLTDFTHGNLKKKITCC